MRKLQNSSQRKEQFRLQALFKEYAPNLHVSMEYPVYSSDGALITKIDFADLDNKIAYRLQRAFSYHDKKGEDLRADLQAQNLRIRGWKVVEVKEDSYEWSFLWD